MAVLVIGYGNPLRCDDGAGWHAAELLAAETGNGTIDAVSSHQLTPELAEPIARADAVIFIDARTDGLPGHISIRTVEAGRPRGGTTTHHVLPSTLLAGAELLYGRCPPAVIASIVGERFDHGDRLSPRVAAALPALVALVRGQASRFCTRE